MVLFLFVAMNFTVLKPFGFQATIDGVRSVEARRGGGLGGAVGEKRRRGRAVPADTARDRAARAAGARRNGPFIQEKLVLSRNTVKTHVANIYGKLGVHSQQELIDLVEEAGDR